MDNTLKEKWVEALRSGRYTQGKGALRNKDGYCCLGVLCDIVDNTKWHDRGLGENAAFYDFNYDGYGYVALLPPAIHDMIPGLTVSGQTILASMNDTGSTFTEIADYIEKMS